MKENRIPQTANIEYEFIERIENVARKYNLTRSSFMRKCVIDSIALYNEQKTLDLTVFEKCKSRAKISMSFTLEPAFIEQAHKIAETRGVRYSKYYRECILQGLVLYEV